MSIVDRLPGLAQRLPEEIKRLEHDKAVGEAAKSALWEANAVNLNRLAQALPVRAILQELIDGRGLKFHGVKPEVIGEVTGDWRLNERPQYFWDIEWTNRANVNCSLGVVLKENGVVEIGSVIQGKSPITHTWLVSASSPLREYDEAIGFAYLDVDVC